VNMVYKFRLGSLLGDWLDEMLFRTASEVARRLIQVVLGIALLLVEVVLHH